MPPRRRSMPRTLYLLSPANTGGQRAAMLFSPRASFDLALRMRSGGATIAEVFTFLSGLYFRGKIAYARSLAQTDHIRVITTDRGLVPHDTIITLRDLEAMAAVPIGIDEPRYMLPLQRDAAALRAQLEAGDRVVLLGSIATPKYVTPLREIFGEALHVPAEFAGRGDMSRGGLMLRHADRAEPMTYVPVAQAERHGARPPKLEPRRKSA